MSNETQAQQSQPQILNLRFFNDPGHGWLEVDMLHIIGLGLAEKISEYSYVQGDYAYLEEDCDMFMFIKEAENNGILVNYISHYTNTDSEIRNYARYSSPFNNPFLG